MRKQILAVVLSFFAAFAFSQTMNSRVRKVPTAIQEQIFVTPEETLPSLVSFLISGSDGTLAKVRVLHDWICDNIAYDTDVYTEQGAGKQDYISVLKKQKGICSGYAQLMRAMCYYAKIETEIVSGWSKGFNYPGYLWEEPDHAWNAVKIGSRWQLIDVTWDAGFVAQRVFIKQYSTQWLNRTPAQFIYSHLPEEEKWQLLPQAEVRTPEQFVQEPYIAGMFFDYGLSLGKRRAGYNNEISEATTFDFSCTRTDISLISGMEHKDSGQAIECADWLEKKPRGAVLTVDVPDSGEYRFRLGACVTGATTNPTVFSKAEFEQQILPQAQNLLAQKKITQAEFDHLQNAYFFVEPLNRYYFADDTLAAARNTAVTKILKLLQRNVGYYKFVFDANVKAAPGYEGYGDTLRFPRSYDNYKNLTHTSMKLPLVGVVEKGSVQNFCISTMDFSSVAIVFPETREFNMFTKNAKTGDFELEYTVPDVPELSVYGSKDGKSYASIITYSVR